MIAKMCAKCNVCAAMPEQDSGRVLRWWWGVRTSEEVDQDKVLVIDDCADKRDVMRATSIARDLLQGELFTYTNTIRCDYIPGEITEEAEAKALARCSVWTHQLLENRMLIISTLSGLLQMQVGDGRREGEMWRNQRLGVVLYIPPLLRMGAIAPYQAKVARVLRERVAA